MWTAKILVTYPIMIGCDVTCVIRKDISERYYYGTGCVKIISIMWSLVKLKRHGIFCDWSINISTNACMHDITTQGRRNKEWLKMQANVLWERWWIWYLFSGLCMIQVDVCSNYHAMLVHTGIQFLCDIILRIESNKILRLETITMLFHKHFPSVVLHK